jgi:NAD(P) transhydrogenase subunit alpha
MKIGVAKETFPGERRVALVPGTIPSLTKAGLTVYLQSGAGLEAGFQDSHYEDKGAAIIKDRSDLFRSVDVVLQVRSLGSNPDRGRADLDLIEKDQVVIGFMDPLSAPHAARDQAKRGAVSFSMELMPRITRAQSMDALSSMANIAGYKAVVMAADVLPRIFPMMMTAAGTIAPARAFVIGAGVAGLQAIATAKRLGAQVRAYDVRPAVAEQIQSLGAKFVEMDLDTDSAEDKGGYAKAMDEDFYRKQRDLMAAVVAESDVVVTTAAIPGKTAPILIDKRAVEGMPLGSVIVDLAAERGGNCELTRAGETVVHGGVTVIGPMNVPAMVPFHASQTYAKNISTFLLHLVEDGALSLNMDDEITRETLVTRGGEVVQPRVKELLGEEGS